MAGRLLLPRFTGGCTIEARDSLDRYRELDAAVVGISADMLMTMHRSAPAKDLTLLSDPDGTVSSHDPMAPYSLRHTFLIDPDGKLQKRWAAVRPSGHAQEVLGELINQQQAERLTTCPVVKGGSDCKRRPGLRLERVRAPSSCTTGRHSTKERQDEHLIDQKSPNGIIPTLRNLFRSSENGMHRLETGRGTEPVGRRNHRDGRPCAIHAAQNPLNDTQISSFYHVTSKECFWPILHTFPLFQCQQR